MKRVLIIVGLVMTVSVLATTATWAGSAAGDTYSSFAGPSLNGTVVLNADKVTAGDVPNGTVAIQVTRGSTSAGVLYDSGYVSGFQNGCDGTLGAAIVSGEGVTAKTNNRFLGVDWLDTAVKQSLLAPFGITPDPNQPLVFSDISHATCTQIKGVWILSFTGTLQFGKQLAQ